MSDAIDKAERFIGRMYTTFVLRDLTFFVSGGLVIGAVANKPIVQSLDDNILLSENLWLVVIAFLGVSYVLGMILQEGARIPLEYLSKKWIKIETDEEESEEELVSRLEEIYQEGCKEETRFGIERILFLKQIGSTQFSSTLILLILCINAKQAPWISIFLAMYLLLCAWTYIYKSRQQEQILRSLEQRFITHKSGLEIDFWEY
jgi:hypothetical protein